MLSYALVILTSFQQTAPISKRYHNILFCFLCSSIYQLSPTKMSFKRRLRDFQRCVRNMKSFSDNQAKINKWDEDSLNWVEVLIRPSGGFYEGGTFRFKASSFSFVLHFHISIIILKELLAFANK